MRMKIECIDKDSVDFPYKLKNIPGCPKKLYFSGDFSLLNNKSVAIVGSRKYTNYGKTVAQMLGKTIGSYGISVVSGLASGIDAFSHKGCLMAEGKAVAVLGTGILNFFPRQNQELMNQIAKNGLVVSEYEPDFQGSKWSFPQRNRIISGLSDIVVVVEAGIKSGALITADFANEQGRTVYSVPGNITSVYSNGTNQLIRDGATPLICVEDILMELGIKNLECEEELVKNLGEDERKIWEIVKEEGGLSVNEIAHRLNTKTSIVSATITVLEIKGFLISYGGKIFIAK